MEIADQMALKLKKTAYHDTYCEFYSKILEERLPGLRARPIYD